MRNVRSPAPVGRPILILVAAWGATWAGTPAQAMVPQSVESRLEAQPARGSTPDSLGPKVVLSGSWTEDAHRSLAGSRPHGAAQQHNLLLSLSARGRVGGSGRVQAEGYLSFLDHGGSGIGERVGDIQGVSNIEARPSNRVYEAWVETTVAEGAGAILVGLYDLNRDFYAVEASKLFLNSSHGIGPEFGLTGEGGPSIYPYTSLALRASAEAAPGLVVRAAVLDAVPGAPGDPAKWGLSLSRDEGALVVGEADLTRGDDARIRLALGAWAYSSPAVQDAAGDARAWGNHGFYAFAEGSVAGCRGGPCLRAFARVGRSAQRINPVGAAFGTGLVLEASEGGPALGVAWAMARSGGGPAGTEGNLEVTARVPVVAGVELLPDLQIIHAPGMDRSSACAAVASLRVSVGF